MRRLPAFLLIAVAALAVAACSSSAAPGWTYAPAASATPIPSGGASGEPSAGASGAPSVGPSATAGASAAPSGGGSALTIKAPIGSATTGFDPATAEAAAGAAFTLTFDNEDNQAPHNLILQDPSGAAVAVQGDTAFFTGPGKREYQVPALTAGAYKYLCQVHPSTMVGTLTVT